MRRLSLVFAAGLLSALAGCGAPEDDSEIAVDPVLYQEDRAEDKADQGALALETLAAGLPEGSSKETRRTFVSAGAFRGVFGTVAPGVDFSRRWVVLYSAGMQNGGGYRATVERVSLTDSGLTLKVVTRLRAPGPGCPVTLGLSRPYQIVTFARPEVAPKYVRYTHLTESAPACN